MPQTEVKEQVGFSQCLLQEFRSRMQHLNGRAEPALVTHSVKRVLVHLAVEKGIMCVCDAQRAQQLTWGAQDEGSQPRFP